MPVKIFSAVVALVLVLAYLSPLVIKLKDLSLGIVVLLGVGMMLVDLAQSLRSKDD
jgi:hypothetical protein